MIPICIKNFFKSLGFYFVPLGILSFFIVLTLAYSIPASINIVKSTFEEIANKVSAASFNWDHIQGVLMNKIFELSSKDPEALIALFTNQDSLVALLQEVAEEAFGISSISGEILDLLKACVTQLMEYVVLLIAMMLVGFFVGVVVLNLLIRSFLTHTNVFKALLMSVVEGIISVLLALLINNVNSVQDWVIILIFVAVLFGSLIFSLLESYLFYGIKKVPFKKVFNIKNIITLLVGDIIILILGISAVGLCFLANSLFVSLFIALPFVLLTTSVLGINASSYTSTLAKEGRILKRAERKALKEQEKAKQIAA